MDADLQGVDQVGSTRRKFTPEYKAEAVQFVISSGKPIAEVARNLGIVEGTLGNWVAKARENGEFKEPPLELSERAEFERMKKELQQVKMERDFLKKAAAFFASQNQ
jgi:transposase